MSSEETILELFNQEDFLEEVALEQALTEWVWFKRWLWDIAEQSPEWE